MYREIQQITHIKQASSNQEQADGQAPMAGAHCTPSKQCSKQFSKLMQWGYALIDNANHNSNMLEPLEYSVIDSQHSII